MTVLILKYASASRPSGEWNDDDFDVLADGAVADKPKLLDSCPKEAHGFRHHRPIIT